MLWLRLNGVWIHDLLVLMGRIFLTFKKDTFAILAKHRWIGVDSFYGGKLLLCVFLC